MHITRGLFSASDLGRAFKENRKSLHKTQTEIAHRVGCQRKTIADIESGKNVTIYTLMAALSALGKGIAIIDAKVDYEQIQEISRDDD